MKRPSWDQIFMEIARTNAKRSTCLRRHVGAVLTKDNHIIAGGYNGAVKGAKHCTDLGVCMRETLKIPSGQRRELCKASHAEANTIAQAAYHGIHVYGSTLYCTTFPCIVCLQLLVNAGIKKIVYEEKYDDPLTTELFKEIDMEVVQYEGQNYGEEPQ